MDLTDIANADYAQPEDTERQKYEEATAHLDDAPDYETITEEQRDLWFPHLHIAQTSTSWDKFDSYIKEHDERISRPNDVHQAMYNEPGGADGERDVRGFEVPNEARPACDRDLAEYVKTSAPDWALPILLRWLELLPRWANSFGLDRAPSTHHAEYYWAPIRMLIAGAGYDHWPALCEALEAVPGCPFDASESKVAWTNANLDAHKMCGWPIHLIHVPYPAMSRWVPPTTPGKRLPHPPPWLAPLAVLHVLKHVRRDPGWDLRVLHRSTVTVYDLNPRVSVLGDNTTLIGSMCRGLGVTAPEKRGWVGEAHEALLSAVKSIGYGDVLTTQDLGRLPVCVFAGSWTRLVPEMPLEVGFVDHRLRLEGAKVATDGKIRTLHSDDEDVLSWAWNGRTANSPEALEERRLGYDSLPDTYETGLPMDIFREQFPNLSAEMKCEDDAYMALLEAPLLASLLRERFSWLGNEYPFIGVLPSVPTAHESTNNGKSTATDCLAGAMVPGLTALAAPDSSSAPDTRSVADNLRRYGTLALDEFVMPRSATHPLSRNNLQTLCTGRQLNAGRVMQDSGTVELRHSVVLGAKFLDLPPDLVNRCFCMFLGPLTDWMRSNWEGFERLEGGLVSLDMRLAALALTDNDEFLSALESLPRASKGLFRFGGHRAIAALMYAIRCGDATVEEKHFDAVDSAHYAMLVRLMAHTDHAEEQGLVEEVEIGRFRPLRLATLIEELPAASFISVRENIDAQAYCSPPRFSILTLIRAIMEETGTNPNDMVRWITDMVGGNGGGGKWTTKKIGSSLRNELKAREDQYGYIRLPAPWNAYPVALRLVGTKLAWVDLEEAEKPEAKAKTEDAD